MTFVGRILVLVITALALVFLGVSTVVFTTATNWKQETEKQKKSVSDLQTKVRDLSAQLDESKKSYAAAQATHKAAMKQQEDQVAALEADIKRAQDEITQSRTALEKAQQNANLALNDAAARKSETDLLREQKLAVEKQANEYKLRQTELNDKIRELSRMLETATNNANDLRDRVARFSTLLRRHGLSDDITTVKGTESPPTVHGEVSRVDAQNRTVEITIGSDDGLVPGHELFLYRVKPRPEFLGKIKIITVDPDQSVGRVIGTTLQNKRIKEGDIVSSTIRPTS
jgi:predicted  nucleic acid-binding Zn-ribbon protein